MRPSPLVIASVGAFITALSTSLVAISAPVVAKDLSATPESVSWILSAYLLAVSSALALAGRAADVLGRKNVYLAGFALFVPGSILCAIAPSLHALVGARVVQGVGSAMVMAVGPAIVTRAAPPDRRARSLGVQLAATYIGLTLGPGLGGVLAARLGWQAVFVVVACAGSLGAAMAALLLPPDTDTRRLRAGALDLGGAALFAFALAALLLALGRTRREGWSSPGVLALGLTFVASLALLGRHARRHTAPLLPLRLFANATFAFGIIGAIVLYVVTFMLAYLLPFELQDVAGLDPARAGAFMTAQPATMAIVAPLSGVLADRWGPRLPSSAGMIAIAGGMASVAATTSHPGLPLAFALALVGVGSGLYVAPNSAMVMGAARRNEQGIASAMAATARNVGMALGIAIAASLHRTLGFEASLHVAAALASAGALLGLVRPVA